MIRSDQPCHTDKTKTIDIENLLTVENRCRQQLGDNPIDMDARLSLAWCLFMQAVHEAGREARLPEEIEAPKNGTANGALNGKAADTGDEGARMAHRPAYHLLRDCLNQTVTILQLSPHLQDQREAQRLQSLANLSGNEQAVLEANREGERIVEELTHDILNLSEPARRPIRRRRMDVSNL